MGMSEENKPTFGCTEKKNLSSGTKSNQAFHVVTMTASFVPHDLNATSAKVLQCFWASGIINHELIG